MIILIIRLYSKSNLSSIRLQRRTLYTLRNSDCLYNHITSRLIKGVMREGRMIMVDAVVAAAADNYLQIVVQYRDQCDDQLSEQCMPTSSA